MVYFWREMVYTGERGENAHTLGKNRNGCLSCPYVEGIQFWMPLTYDFPSREVLYTNDILFDFHGPRLPP